MSRCDLTELLVEDCAHCRLVETYTWPARYEGLCKAAGCNTIIDVGELVKWSQDGTSTIHARHKE